MSNLRASFFRDGEFDRVEIKIVGDPNTYISKVSPDHISQFPREWESYKANRPDIDYGGTDLTEIPGMTPQMATAYKLKGIHNVEMFADLSDAAALGLGMGGITLRNTAQLVLKAKGIERDEKTFVSKSEAAVSEAIKKRGRPPKAKPEETPAQEPEQPAPALDIPDHEFMPVEE